MSDQDAATTRATLVALRTVTAVLAVIALVVGLFLSDSSNVFLVVGLVLGAAALVLAAASGLFKRLTVGSAIVLVIGIVLVGIVLIDLTNG